jgi:gentisate 1,2-dioxygenase
MHLAAKAQNEAGSGPGNISAQGRNTMSAVTQDELARVNSLDELYGKLASVGMGPGWNKPAPAMWAQPRRSFQPVHFSYHQAKGALDAAGRLISTELAERRNLILFNPLEGNTYATTRTLVSAYQMILPGEHARAHRHVPNALRLIVDAEPGTYTVVDGKKVSMLPGDVVLTPNWRWHGHGNDSKAPAYWIDFLDVPLVQMLEPMFFELHEEGFERDITQEAASPLLFPWAETEQKLSEAPPDPSGHFGAQVELGDPALETIGLYMMRLAAGKETKPYKTTANNIYGVAQGRGATVVEGRRFEWERGDVIAVPSWYEHHHQGGEGAVLLRVTDAPAMASLGLLRNAAEN